MYLYQTDIAKSTKESRAKAAQEKAELAKVNYDRILPEANACFEQNKFGEALNKYHKAMEDPLPDGTVSLEVLDRVFKCLKMLIDIDIDDDSLIKQLECVERCLVLSKCEHDSHRSIEHHIMHIRILLKLLSSNQPKTNERFVLYHGLLCKGADHVCSASVDDSVKSSCMSWKADADQLLHTRAKSFKYKQTDEFLQSLEGINAPQKLITTAQQMMNEQGVHKGVQPILRKMIELEKSDTPKDKFKSEVDKLLVELAELLHKLTGRVINFGNGLSPWHLLFVLMNYATPTSTHWNDEWPYDVMNPNESCIGFWRQSIITCLERGAGVTKSDDDKHDDSCISTTDRLFWRCNTNTSSYKNEIDPVCKLAGITRDEMHLIPVIILALKVKYAKLCGHVPIILSTGSEARDNLFKATGTVITQHAIFAGCVPHSEMFQRKERFLAWYDIDEQQEISQTLARFYASDYYTTSGCTVVEDWSGLGYLSKEEQEAFAKEQRRLMHEQRRRGGLTTAELAKLASALHDAGWDYENLSMDMKLVFAWCLEHKNRNLKEEEVFDDDEFIEFLTELRDSRVDGGQKGGKKGAKTTNEMATLASKLHKVGEDYNKLSSAAKLVFELHMARKKIDEDKFIKFLTELRDSRKKGGKDSTSGKTTGEMKQLASVLYDDEVDGDYNKLSPEWQFIFDLHMARKKMDETTFKSYLQKLHGTNNFKSGKTEEEFNKQQSANRQAGWDKQTQKEIQESKGWAVTLSCPNDCGFTRTKGLNAYNKMKQTRSNPQFRCQNCKNNGNKLGGWTETKPFQTKVKDDSSNQTTLSEPTKKSRGSKTSTDTSKKETKKKKKISTDTLQNKTITATKRKKTTSTTKKSSTNIKNDSSTTTQKKKKMTNMTQQTINFKPQTKVKNKRKAPTANTSTQPTIVSNKKQKKTDKKKGWKCKECTWEENEMNAMKCSMCNLPRA